MKGDFPIQTGSVDKDMRHDLSLAALPVSAVLFCLLAHGFAQRKSPEPIGKRTTEDRGSYYTGRYPDLFVAAGRTPGEVRAKIAAGYAQLFLDGDPATQRINFMAGSNHDGDLAYILNPGDGDVRTEGMSYAMMIAVQLDHKREFDAVWNWARTYMYEADPAAPAHGYYAWSCKPDGTHLSDTPSPDGEEYFAMALYFAAARWGSGKGIYDYRARADELLHTILHKKQTAGPTPFGLKDIGPEFDASSHLPVFLAEPGGRTFSDPSYVLPGFYELWARWGPPEDRAFWAEAARAGRTFFARTANPSTGLTPVYANFNGSPHATAFAESANFGHDAFRTAGNWSWDWSWFRSGVPDLLCQ